MLSKLLPFLTNPVVKDFAMYSDNICNKMKIYLTLTLTNMSTFVSPIRYFPSETLIIGNCVGQVHFSTKSRTWKREKIYYLVNKLNVLKFEDVYDLVNTILELGTVHFFI